eukprot:tig00020830_g14437.t1
MWPRLPLDLGHVFSVIAKEGHMSLEQATSRFQLHPRAAGDFLKTLESLGFLHRDDGGLYGNTPLSALYLDRARESCVAGILQMMNSRLYPAWGALGEALTTGLPTNEMRGLSSEEMQRALSANDGKDSFMSDPNFSKAMTGLNLYVAAKLAEVFPWHKYRSLCDLGTAEGAIPTVIAQKHPHLTAIGFDLPAVGPTFEAYVKSKNLQERVRFVGGDFFAPEKKLPQADVLIYGTVLHDWDLAQKRALLAKAHESLAPGGVCLVYDAMTDGHDATSGLIMSLNMLVELPGGFNYGKGECEGWLREAGFTDVHSLHVWSSVYAVVGTKP